MMPKLFGTISCNIGDPIYVDSKLTGEAFDKKREEIQKIMQKQLREMDAEFNLPVIESGLDATTYKEKIRNQKKR